MKASKGSTLLNIVFGIFMLVNIIKTSNDLYTRYKKREQKARQ